ncbi:MAG: 30S ribosomal protein S1 [Pyrinomonadaceae bacterium]
MTNQVNNEADETVIGTDAVSEQSNNENTTEVTEASAVENSSDETQSSGDIDFGAILEQFEQDQTIYHAGELVEGKIVGVSDHGVLVDFGYKSEGIVAREDFMGPDGELTVNVGDTVEVVIRTIHSGDAAPQLSRADALNRKVWGEIEKSYHDGTTVTGRVIDKTKGGLRIDLNGIEAFLPGSQIDSRPIRNLDSYIGQEIETKIVKFSRRRNNIVLSRKVLTDEVINKQKNETLSVLEVGHVAEGTIKNLTEYGAFVDIGGIDGLLHVTDMSWGRIHHPGDQFGVGDHIQVKILKLDKEKEKVSLGYKQLLPDPWSTVVEVYLVDSKITGIVSSVTEYGVFVELEPGVEGLVHVSEISWSKRSQSPKRLFKKGDEVEVQVLGVDTVEKRISLGMKQFQQNPWDHVEERYPVGSKIHGRVRNLTDFGAFVELEEGIDGLVHVSDITWSKKVKHPKELLKKDQEVDAIVTNIDKAGQRLSLSMKDLMPSAWEGFVATHRPGDQVKGRVSRFTTFGIFVELGEGLEGLCHISELSDERVEKAEDVAELGQEMDFKILRIEHEDQKIGLSHRAVGKENEPIVDSRMYSSEAKGGMASLGELANLKFGRTDDQPETVPAKAEKVESKTSKKPETVAEPEKAEVEDGAAEETEAEELQIEEASAEVVAVEEAVPEEVLAEETVAEELPIEETSAEEAPTEEAAVEESPVEGTPVEETPVAEGADEMAAVEESSTVTTDVALSEDIATEVGEASIPSEVTDAADDEVIRNEKSA